MQNSVALSTRFVPFRATLPVALVRSQVYSTRSSKLLLKRRFRSSHSALAANCARKYCTPSPSDEAQSSAPSSLPVIAIIKEYVAAPSGRKEEVTRTVVSKIRPKLTSGYSEGAPDGGKVLYTEDEEEEDKLEPQKKEENVEESRTATHFKVFIAASPGVRGASSASKEALTDTKESRESNFKKLMVTLEEGSVHERIIKNHGLAALSYSEAYELVAEANGIRSEPRVMAGAHNMELDDPPARMIWDEEAKEMVEKDVSELPPEPGFFVRQLEKLWGTMASAFLPTGYPSTVSGDYDKYYRYLFLQNVAGSFSYVMSMTALLQAVGIGSGGALGAAAAISWVMKDGLGAIGMIFAAKVLGDANTFDANTIRSKFRADLVHNLGVSLELLTLLFPGSFLLLASLANTLKGVAGLVNGACKASINQRMAIANNLGDLTAKGHVQGLAAYLTGLSLGVLFDRVSSYLTKFLSGPMRDSIAEALQTVGMGEFSESFLNWSSFLVTTTGDAALATASSSAASIALVGPLFVISASLHMFCSYRALRALALPSLNQSRSHLLASKFIDAHPIELSFPGYDTVRTTPIDTELRIGKNLKSPASDSQEHVPNPSQLPTPFDISKEASERIVLPSILDSSLPRIVLGASVSTAFARHPSTLQPLIAKSIDAPYIIHGDDDGSKVWVVLAPEASPRSMLRAFFHACAARRIIAQTSSPEFNVKLWQGYGYDKLREYVDLKYPYFEAQVEAAGWRLDQILLSPSPTRASWTLSNPPRGVSDTPLL